MASTSWRSSLGAIENRNLDEDPDDDEYARDLAVVPRGDRESQPSRIRSVETRAGAGGRPSGRSRIATIGHACRMQGGGGSGGRPSGRSRIATSAPTPQCRWRTRWRSSLGAIENRNMFWSGPSSRWLLLAVVPRGDRESQLRGVGESRQDALAGGRPSGRSRIATSRPRWARPPAPAWRSSLGAIENRNRIVNVTQDPSGSTGGRPSGRSRIATPWETPTPSGSGPGGRPSGRSRIATPWGCPRSRLSSLLAVVPRGDRESQSEATWHALDLRDAVSGHVHFLVRGHRPLGAKTVG